MKSIRGFTASDLKLIVCLSMVLDHIGMMLLPQHFFLRILGRLAFPIFAFFIAAGCRYTKNRKKRFLLIFSFGVLCQAAYVIFTQDWYGNILLTFSLSVLLIYALQWAKSCIFTATGSKRYLGPVAFLAAMAAVYVLTLFWEVDYGFAGVMTPVLISLFDDRDGTAPEAWKRLDTHWVRLGLFAFALLLVAMQPDIHPIQYYSLFTIPLLALYNGKPGAKGFDIVPLE